MFEQHMIESELLVANLAYIFRWIFLRNWHFFGLLVESSMTNALFESGKLFRANIAGK